MGKQFTQAPRGGFGQRGAPRGRGMGGGRGGGRGGFAQRGGFDQGPPSYVVPFATFVHKAQNSLVVKCSDMSRFPKFNRGVFLQNKAKIGTVDEIFGPIKAFYFSIKPVDGVDPKSFKEGQVLYMNPEDLLSSDRFTKPQAPRPKGPRGPPGGNRFGGPPQRGGFNNRGRGAPGGRPPFNNGPGGARPFRR